MRFRTTTGSTSSAGEIDEGHDQHDGDGLNQNPQAHDPVGMLAVEIAALGKSKHADHQYNHHRKAGDRGNYEKWIPEHGDASSPAAASYESHRLLSVT